MNVLAAVSGVAIVVAVLASSGYLLPEVRRAASNHLIPASPDAVVEVMFDVASQAQWRSDIAQVTLSDQGWTERNRAGENIVFRVQQRDDKFFRVQFTSSRGYTGQWTAEIDQIDPGTTRVTVSEHVSIPSPLGRILSHLFFDPEAFVRRYLNELENEVLRRIRERDE